MGQAWHQEIYMHALFHFWFIVIPTAACPVPGELVNKINVASVPTCLSSSRESNKA